MEHSPEQKEKPVQLESIESLDTLEGGVGKISNIDSEAREKLDRLLGKSDSLKDTLESKLTALRNAAILATALSAVPAFAQEEISTESLDSNPVVEQLKEVVTTTPNVANSLAQSIVEIGQAKITERVDTAKESVETLGKTDATLSDKIDAGIALSRAIPGVANKIPHLAIIENLQNIQKDIRDGKSAQEIAVTLFKGLLSAKTLGLSDFAFNLLSKKEDSSLALKGKENATEFEKEELEKIEPVQ